MVAVLEGFLWLHGGCFGSVFKAAWWLFWEAFSGCMVAVLRVKMWLFGGCFGRLFVAAWWLF